jgi:hypothetical protein
MGGNSQGIRNENLVLSFIDESTDGVTPTGAHSAD